MKKPLLPQQTPREFYETQQLECWHDNQTHSSSIEGYVYYTCLDCGKRWRSEADVIVPTPANLDPED